MSRIVDSQGRLLGRVNLVDLLVLVVIVAIVVFAATRLTGGGVGVQTIPVKVTFLEKSVDSTLVPGLQTKGTVTDGAGNVIGEVQSIRSAPTTQELVTSGGELKAFASNTRSDVTFVVLGQGTVSDSTVHIGRLAVRVGTAVQLIGPGYEAPTTIAKVVWGAEALR